jgi:hypothetical protein
MPSYERSFYWSIMRSSIFIIHSKLKGSSPLLQGTHATLWLSSAIFFSCPDYQGMELVKKFHIFREIVHKKFLQIMICGLVVHQIVSM